MCAGKVKKKRLACAAPLEDAAAATAGDEPPVPAGISVTTEVLRTVPSSSTCVCSTVTLILDVAMVAVAAEKRGQSRRYFYMYLSALLKGFGAYNEGCMATKGAYRGAKSS